MAKEIKKICQTCKHHSNKPSVCKRRIVFVGRKSTCDYWDSKKK